MTLTRGHPKLNYFGNGVETHGQNRLLEKTAQETVQKTVPAGKPSFQLKTGKKLFVKPSLKQNLLKLQLVYIREPILVKLFYHGYFIDFIENENELLSTLMVKFINRNLSLALALPIVPSQILYPPATYIFVADTTAVLQLRRAGVCQKGPHVQICSQ